MTTINETEYYKSIDQMRDADMSIQSRLCDVCDIFKKLSGGELNDETSDEFLYASYVDAVMEMGGIIKCVFGCVQNGVLRLSGDDSDEGAFQFHQPRHYDYEDEDEDEDDYEQRMYIREDEDDYERMYMRKAGEDMFKNAVMDALLAIDEYREKVAKFMMTRTSKTEYKEWFYVYSGGAHRAVSDMTIIKLYRCLRHIHSGGGDVKFDFKFGDINRFDAMFCSKNTVADYSFFVNARDSFREPVVEFDPAITHHDTTKYATVRGFVCATTGEVIKMR
jgi:hypothetical protein